MTSSKAVLISVRLALLTLTISDEEEGEEERDLTGVRSVCLSSSSLLLLVVDVDGASLGREGLEVDFLAMVGE